MKTINNIVKCGQSDCDIKDSCPHAKDHKRESDCNKVCIRNNGEYKCYTIIEQRKIKLEKLKYDY